MEQPRRRYWGDYLRDLADRLGLRDWTPFVYEDPAAEGCIAQVQSTYGRKRFKIRFQVGFDRLDPEEQRQTCIHELIHVHFAAYSLVEDEVRQTQDKQWLHRYLDVQHLHMEYAVDALADAIAPFMPLPPTEDDHGDEQETPAPVPARPQAGRPGRHPWSNGADADGTGQARAQAQEGLEEDSSKEAEVVVD